MSYTKKEISLIRDAHDETYKAFYTTCQAAELLLSKEHLRRSGSI
jgi:hypothetical protein